jgi:hypothetical protein
MFAAISAQCSAQKSWSQFADLFHVIGIIRIFLAIVFTKEIADAPITHDCDLSFL